MEHKEAIEMMASEKYLLNELTPELRDAYEEHLFSCEECANDALFGAAFVHHAKAILPTMDMKKAPLATTSDAQPKPAKRDWFAWLRPAIMVPVFASLIAIIGYQNLFVLPSLERAASEPRILPPATVLHGDTRGGVPVVHADLRLGSTVTVELPQGSGYAAYRIDFYNSQSKLIWTQSIKTAEGSDDTVTLWLPGRVKQDSYKLALSGVTSTGENVPLHQQFFDLQVNK